MKDDQIRILFLAANPKTTAPLDLDGEFEQIESQLHETRHSERFLVQHRWKLGRDQLLDFFLKYRPHIVHFSGHGTEGNLILQSRDGNSWPLDGAAAREAFKATHSTTRLVVLNACYSRDVAEEISEIVDCVVGMAQPIHDRTAVTFAAALYRGLGEGLSIREAFDQARAQINLSALPGSRVPQILSRPGLDPRRIYPLTWLGVQGVDTSQNSTESVNRQQDQQQIPSTSRVSEVKHPIDQKLAEALRGAFAETYGPLAQGKTEGAPDPRQLAPRLVVIDQFFPRESTAFRERPLAKIRSRKDIDEILLQEPLRLRLKIPNRLETVRFDSIVELDIEIRKMSDWHPANFVQQFRADNGKCHDEFKLSLQLLGAMRQVKRLVHGLDKKTWSFVEGSILAAGQALASPDFASLHGQAKLAILPPQDLVKLLDPEQAITDPSSTAPSLGIIPPMVLDKLLNELSEEGTPSPLLLRRMLALLIVAAAPSDSKCLLGTLFDEALGKLEERVFCQIDEILHSPTFQEYEARWRGLEMMVESLAGDASVSMLSANLQEIRKDMEQDDYWESSLFKILYKNGIGCMGEIPAAAIVLGYFFNTTASDSRLLRKLSNLAAGILAPIIGNLSPKGIKSRWVTFERLGMLSPKDLLDEFSEESKPEWVALRRSANARYLGLALPRLAGRAPYHPQHNPAGSGLDGYAEQLRTQNDYLFVGPSFLIGRQILKSFKRTGFPHHITGSEGGTIDCLPALNFTTVSGQPEQRRSVEVLLTYKEEQILALDLGLIPVLGVNGRSEVRMMSVPSVQLAGFSNTLGAAATLNYSRGVVIDNMLLMLRLMQCLVLFHRSLASARLPSSSVKQTFEAWLQEFKYPPLPAEPELLHRYPLKNYEIVLRPESRRPGWYMVTIELFPVDTFQGADISISLNGEEFP